MSLISMRDEVSVSTSAVGLIRACLMLPPRVRNLTKTGIALAE